MSMSEHPEVTYHRGLTGKDILGAVLAIAVGAAALMGTREMSSLGSVFPATASVVLIAASVLMLVRPFLPGAQPVADPVVAAPDWPRFAAIVAILFAWALLLRPLGFITTAALGMLLIGLIVMREKMTLKHAIFHLLAATVLIAAFYLMLAEVLRVNVPVCRLVFC